MKILLIIPLALLISCGKCPHQDEPHCVVTAFAVNQWGGRQRMDEWGNATPPVKQADGTFKFYNHFEQVDVTCPANSEFIVEGPHQ